MGSDFRVAVAGATGALGAEIVKVLDGASWRPAQLVAAARATTTTAHVDYGDARVSVDDLDEETLDGVDGLILAVPAGAAALADLAVRRGIPVVDCSQAHAEDPSIPLVVPWINPGALVGLERGMVAIPDPSAHLVASILGPLARAGIGGPALATVLVPASREGKGGIDELSRQVVALFNAGTPPRKVFPNGLAFDLLPALGSTVQEDGWTLRERQIAAQIARLVGTDAPIDVTQVGVPVFSGLAVELALTPARTIPTDLVLRILTDAGVALPESAGVRYLPRPRRVEGKPFTHVGRVRTGSDGRTLHVWGSADNLRATAAAAAAALAVLLGVASGLGATDGDS